MDRRSEQRVEAGSFSVPHWATKLKFHPEGIINGPPKDQRDGGLLVQQRIRRNKINALVSS